MNTIENNKLIDLWLAEFEQHESDKLNIINDITVKGHAPRKFHESWDLIMPVVEQLESFDEFIVEITFNQCKIRDEQYRIASGSKEIRFEEIWTEEETKLEATYKAVTAFIKWHNQNK